MGKEGVSPGGGGAARTEKGTPPRVLRRSRRRDGAPAFHGESEKTERNCMKNRVRRKFFGALLTVGLILCAHFAAYAASDGMSPEQMLETAKEQESAVTGEDPRLIPDSRLVVTDRTENDIRVTSIAGQCLEKGNDQVFYVIGKDYVPEGSALPAVFGAAVEYSCTEEASAGREDGTYCLMRFAVRRTGERIEEDGAADDGTDGSDRGDKEAVAEDRLPARRRWNLGDLVLRTIDGVSYAFRCIDQNYGEGDAMGQSLALFLCESVIPADTGSEMVYGKREDGSFGYEFHPGPIVNFGESAEYADSAVRAWLTLNESDSELFPDVNVGVDSSCTGRTADGLFSRFSASDLTFHRLGSQYLTGKYFILSLEEALRYREYLWKVDGCGEEESAANTGTFSRGYWLRTPMGDGSGKDTGFVYIVDLVNGSLHPQAVKPDAEGETDPELAVTGPIGVRPAFVLRQAD